MSCANHPSHAPAAPEIALKSGSKVSFRVVAALALWLAVVCGATVFMVHYSSTPGENSPAPKSWPKTSQFAREGRYPTLLMFVHPHCPCSRASLGELDRLLAELSKPVIVHVIFVKPPGTAAEWEKTDLWRTASSIRGVRVDLDDAGLEAQRFHAQTSGQTLLYSPKGELQFQGGITFARGHAGDNAGRTAVRELLEEGRSNQTQTPVFGCGLFNDQCEKGDVVCKH